MTLHLRATGRHLPYGITQCYLPPDTSEHPRLTPAMQTGTRFTYPRGIEGWVDLVDLIAPLPGVEPAIFRSRVQRRTAAPPGFCPKNNGFAWVWEGYPTAPHGSHAYAVMSVCHQNRWKCDTGHAVPQMYTGRKQTKLSWPVVLGVYTTNQNYC